MLFADSTPVADIEAGTVNGYRLHVIDPSGSQTDGVYRDDVGVARPRRKSFRF